MSDIVTIIMGAVENKYDEATTVRVKALVESELMRLSKNRSVKDLLSNSCPTTNFESDIKNQAKCIYVIENCLRFEQPRGKFIERLYSLVCGVALTDISYRHDEYVKDFGGVVPGQIEKIKTNLQELNIIIKNVDIINKCSLGDKAQFLSEIFAKIIKTHPFADGNGRVARMIVQYCVRFWGYEYILIPKVRNCNVWKSALSRGVNGSYYEMGKYIIKKLKKTH